MKVLVLLIALVSGMFFLFQVAFADEIPAYANAIVPPYQIVPTDENGNTIQPKFINKPIYFHFNVTNGYEEPQDFEVDQFVFSDDSNELLVNKTDHVHIEPGGWAAVVWEYTPKTVGNYFANAAIRWIPLKDTAYHFVITDPAKKYNTATVSILDESKQCAQWCFFPSFLSVTPYTIVTWTNNGSFMHKIATGTYYEEPDGVRADFDGVFQSTMLGKNETFSFMFIKPGKYDYFGVLRLNMKGTIEVEPKQAPPLQQFRSGIPVEQVQCKEGLARVIKSSNSIPICVKSGTVPELVKRGVISSTFDTTNNPGLVIPRGDLLTRPVTPNCTADASNEFPFAKNYLSVIPERLVFFVKANSSANLCVKYTSNLPNNGASPAFLQAYVGSDSTTYNTTADIDITANPNEIPLEKGSGTMITYTVSAHDKTGTYWIFMAQSCELIPVIVWSDAMDVSPLDIPLATGTRSCPMQFLDEKIIGSEGGVLEYRPFLAIPRR